MADGEASPVLHPAEHDLDAVAPFVSEHVVADGFGSGFKDRNAGRDALGL